MKRRLLYGLCLFLSAWALSAQVLTPVKWTSSVEKTGENTYDLVFTARIDSGWHLYSQNLPDGGPVPTSFAFEGAGKGYRLSGSVQEGEPAEVYDPAFGMNVRWFDRQARFVQRVEVTSSSLGEISASVTFMACDDTRCLAPEVEDFTWEIAAPSGDMSSADVLSAPERPVMPNNMWGMFFFALGLGFLALLTPCVYPMIPMTVSFFLKQSKSLKRVLFYGSSIVVIYVGLGLLITALFGATALNQLATDPWFNLFFFLLLVVFGLSFLGAFEIRLPSSWVNAADRKSDVGGFFGIFFMALVLALVSFSCTGPFIGTILVEAASKGELWGPAVGMLGFSLGLSIPFTLFAFFPSWLSSLPSSGGWLNAVKVVLGLLEIALALKFLSTADMVLQLGVLTREIFLALWIAVFAVITLYLFGKISFPHDTPLKHVGVTRALLGILSLAFTVYLVPGLWGAPVKLISGLVPPSFYAEAPSGFFTGSAASTADAVSGRHAGPNRIPVFTDYLTGMEYAKGKDLPVLLDFTGWGCPNCREMEADVWSDPAVKRILSEDFVVISLYVDEKTPLPADQQYVSSRGKKIKTVGAKWSDFQIERFNRNAQPFYIVLDAEGNPLGEGRGHDTDVDAYIRWLEKGKEAFFRTRP